MQDWEQVYSRRARRLRASEIREAFSLAERDDIISFAGGFPTPEAFPVEILSEIAGRVCAEEPTCSLQYGPTEGLTELRQLIAEQMVDEGVAGISCENILITNGSQQALDLVCKVFLDPGDRVVVDLPAYIGGLGAINNYEAVPVGVPSDGAGMRVDVLEERLATWRRQGTLPKLLYYVPNFENPSGITMIETRRKRLAELAAEYGFVIVEDDAYGKLRFEGEDQRHIKVFDEAGHVIYLGSFSKILTPGFRLGWIVGERELIRKLTIAKQATDLCSTTFGQKVIIEFLNGGHLEEHLSRLREVYRSRRDAMLQSLEQFTPPGTAWTKPEGGFFILLTAPTGVDTRRLLPAAVKRRVAYVPGKAFFVDGSGENTIRLAYSQAEIDEIHEGIRRLCGLLAEADGMLSSG